VARTLDERIKEAKEKAATLEKKKQIQKLKQEIKDSRKKK
jgi:hypothetical protein